MADNLSPEQRRRCMQRIRRADTSPELILRKALHNRGFRFRKNASWLPGCPDIAFTRQRVAIFADGDFWHGRDLIEGGIAGLESTFENTRRREWWIGKISRTVERDRIVNQMLISQGWEVLRVWASDVKRDRERVVNAIVGYLSADRGPGTVHAALVFSGRTWSERDELGQSM